MSFSPPNAPDPTATSNTQQQYNTQAAAAQQKANSFNQEAPTGTMQYVTDPSSPSGYKLVSSLSAPQQNLLDIRTGTQATTGQAGLDLAKNSAGMYSKPYDFNSATGAVAGKLNDWSARYVQPIFNQQSSNLEAQLRNQGLMPGTAAYDNAKNLLARNQGDVTNQYLQQNEGQAFGQAMQEYQTPLSTIGGLFGMSGPTGPTFQNTPTANIQPANYQGAVQSNYENQLKNYENTWNNIGKLGTAGVGLAISPGSTIPGIFKSAASSIQGGWG